MSTRLDTLLRDSYSLSTRLYVISAADTAPLISIYFIDSECSGTLITSYRGTYGTYGTLREMGMSAINCERNIDRGRICLFASRLTLELIQLVIQCTKSSLPNRQFDVGFITDTACSCMRHETFRTYTLSSICHCLFPKRVKRSELYAEHQHPFNFTSTPSMSLRGMVFGRSDNFAY